MLDSISLVNVLDSLVPISKFNQGGASKIFDEIKKKGYGVVVKNNTPACILVSPEKYQEMAEIIENYYLLQLAQERNDASGETIPQTAILEKYHLTEDELDETEVDFE